MKSLISKIMIALISVFIIFSGCDQGGDGEKQSGDAIGSFASNVKTDVTGTCSGSTLVIANGNVKAGDIVLLNGSSTASIAKKIESINGNTATVSDASINEVFTSLVIDEKTQLGAENFISNKTAARTPAMKSFSIPDVIITETASGLTFSINNHVLYDNDKYGINVSAGASISISKPVVQVSYDLVTGNSSSTITIAETGSFNLNANLDRAALVDKDILLGTFSYPISVSGICIAEITFDVILNVGVTGEASLSFKFNQGMEATSGIQTVAGVTSTIQSITPPAGGSSFYNFTVSGSADFEAWASLYPQASLEILQFRVLTIRPDLGVSADVQGIFASTGDTLESGGFDLTLVAHAKASAIFFSLYDDAVVLFDETYTYEYNVAPN